MGYQFSIFIVPVKMSAIDFLQFQEFANVFDELSRGEKRKTSPTKSDDESPTSKIKSEPLSLQENVFQPAPFAFENESIMIKSEPSGSDFTLDLKNLKIPPLPPLGSNIPPSDLVSINPHEIPESERQFSNSMGDCCTHLCRICGKSVTVTGMRNHTRTSHGIPIHAYASQFGNYREQLEKVMWHRCGLCAKVFLLDGDEIHKHCNSHRILQSEYTKKFIVHNYVSSRRKGYVSNKQNFKLVNMNTQNTNSNFDIKTLDLGVSKMIGTIKIKKESIQQADVKPNYRILNSLPKAASAGPPGPPGPTTPPAPPRVPGPPGPPPQADVFGTINEIEDILAKLPDSL